MYIGLRQKKKILTFLVIFFLLISSGVGFLLYTRDAFGDFFSASNPKNVVLSNVWEDSVTVTWTTDIKTEGYLVLYKGREKVGEFEDSRGLKKRNEHFVNIHALEPGTIYEFEIFSAGEKRLNDDGSKFKFTTRPVLSYVPSSSFANGSVNESNVLVFISLDDLSDSYPVTTYVSESGNWSLDLSKIWSNYDVRDDSALRVMFYTDSGVKVFRGNKNVLFDDENNFFENEFSLEESDNIFLNISDIAKFVGDPVVVESEEGEVVEEVEAADNNVLGVEVEPEIKIETRNIRESSIKWDSLDKKEDMSDYGIN